MTENSDVGQIERKTQNRIVELFKKKLGYIYLGNWEEREKNGNIEVKYLRAFLERSGHSKTLINKAIDKLRKCANRSQMSLYDLNKETYSLLRYGAKEREKLGQNKQNIEFIDWEHPKNNDFAIAEEVTIRGNRTKRPDVVLYINGIAVGVIDIISVSEGNGKSRVWKKRID